MSKTSIMTIETHRLCEACKKRITQGQKAVRISYDEKEHHYYFDVKKPRYFHVGCFFKRK